MKKPRQDAEEPLHDRALLLHGRKRNKVLTLEEVQRYGSDSFSDPDYIRLYGMTPPQWYVRGVRLLGRTAVECTRDPLADRIGRDVAAVAASLPPETPWWSIPSQVLAIKTLSPTHTRPLDVTKCTQAKSS